jgi:DTW domain-containing protein
MATSFARCIARRRHEAIDLPLTEPHSVSRLRAARLARSTKPFLARGGSVKERCEACRLVVTHCLCSLRPSLYTRAGVCLLMGDIEALKPSNTGWLVADLVQDTFAFEWTRTSADPALLALLLDPQWLPMVVYPGEFVESARVVREVPSAALASHEASAKRPLFILLDGTWAEAGKMFRKSPYLASLPVLSLQSNQLSRYRLRRSTRGDHFCTAEVAALCLALAGEAHAAQTLDAYLDVFSHHYLQAKQQKPANMGSELHARLTDLNAMTSQP